MQTVRHRDYFLPPEGGSEETHAAPPSLEATQLSLIVLLVALVSVVLLAKQLTPIVEWLVNAFTAPKSVIAVVIATLVLLPEGLARIMHQT